MKKPIDGCFISRACLHWVSSSYLRKKMSLPKVLSNSKLLIHSIALIFRGLGRNLKDLVLSHTDFIALVEGSSTNTRNLKYQTKVFTCINKDITFGYGSLY